MSGCQSVMLGEWLVYIQALVSRTIPDSLCLFWQSSSTIDFSSWWLRNKHWWTGLVLDARWECGVAMRSGWRWLRPIPAHSEMDQNPGCGRPKWRGGLFLCKRGQNLRWCWSLFCCTWGCRKLWIFHSVYHWWVPHWSLSHILLLFF